MSNNGGDTVPFTVPSTAPSTGSSTVSLNLEQQLLRFINAEVSLLDDPIEVDTDLLLTGAVDSLGVMSITRWIEDELDIDIEATDITLDNFQTVEQTLRYCRSRIG